MKRKPPGKTSRLKGQHKTRASSIQHAKVTRTLPLPMWDKDKFYKICADRGYLTERSVVFILGEELNLARSVVLRMLSTGRFRWEQILVIGSFLEMTPKEFCDVFLAGFFREDDLGHFRCHVDNKVFLLDPPKVRDGKTKADILEERRDKILQDLDSI